jgi:hypothetical protein
MPAGPAGHRLLYGALARCGEIRMTGTLHVKGRPGGVFHFRRGLVVAVRTPGAPGPETLLARTGRLAGPGSGADGEAEAKPIGAAEFEVVQVVAAYDAAFAVIAGSVEGCAVDEDAEPDPHAAARGEEPESLVREALRRVEALSRLPHVVLPHDDVMAVAAGVDREGGGGTPIRRDVLRLADGRRTCRDIAYATAHGVYAVAVEAAWMLEDGLLERVAPDQARVSVEREATRPILPRRPAPAQSAPDAPRALPRRTPGRNGIDSARIGAESNKDWADFAELRDMAT